MLTRGERKFIAQRESRKNKMRRGYYGRGPFGLLHYWFASIGMAAARWPYWLSEGPYGLGRPPSKEEELRDLQHQTGELLFDPTGQRERDAARAVEVQADANAQAVLRAAGLDGVRGDRVRWALDQALIKKIGW